MLFNTKCKTTHTCKITTTTTTNPSIPQLYHPQLMNGCLLCFVTSLAGTHCTDPVSLGPAVIPPASPPQYSMGHLVQLSDHPFEKVNKMLRSQLEYPPFTTNLSGTVSVQKRPHPCALGYLDVAECSRWVLLVLFPTHTHLLIIVASVLNVKICHRMCG